MNNQLTKEEIRKLAEELDIDPEDLELYRDSIDRKGSLPLELEKIRSDIRLNSVRAR